MLTLCDNGYRKVTILYIRICKVQALLSLLKTSAESENAPGAYRSVSRAGGTEPDTRRLKHQEFPGLPAQIYEKPHLFPVRPFSRRICHATLLELAPVDNDSLNTFVIRH